MLCLCQSLTLSLHSCLLLSLSVSLFLWRSLFLFLPRDKRKNCVGQQWLVHVVKMGAFRYMDNAQDAWMDEMDGRIDGRIIKMD